MKKVSTKKKEGDQIANEHARSQKRTKARRRAAAVAEAKASTARDRAARLAADAAVNTFAVNPVRPTADELSEYREDPMSSQAMFAQLSGFDVNGQAFGEKATFEPIDDAVRSERMDAYHKRVRHDMPIVGCAACGVLSVGDDDDDARVVALESLVLLRLSDEVSACRMISFALTCVRRRV